MARSLSSAPLTPADELRQLLGEAEKRAVNVRGSGPEQALELLRQLDAIAVLLPRIQAQGVSLQAEEGRWQTVQGAVKRHARDILREAGKGGGLERWRTDLPESPPPERWWWWLDVSSRQRTLKSLRKSGMALALILLLLAGGVFLFRKLFPVDPALAESYRLQTDAEQLVMEGGDLSIALEKLEAANALTPDDPSILAWLVGLQQVQQQPQQAEARRAQLFEVASPSSAHTLLAETYARLHDFQRAADHAQQAIAADPDNAAAYLAAAGAALGRNDVQQAIRYLQSASDVAERTNDPQVQALARIQLATLLQKATLPTPKLTPSE